jgi:hypothetical protein
MDQKTFDDVIDITLEKVRTILGRKQAEYARGDRLHNFKVAGAIANTTPEMALRGMMAKHVVSVYDLIKDIEDGKKVEFILWDEKTLDTINYLILLRALLYERDGVGI